MPLPVQIKRLWLQRRECGRADADRIIGLLEPHVESPKLVVNRIRPNMVKSGDMLEIEDVAGAEY